MTLRTRPDGYQVVYVGRRHPLADRAGQVYLHRLVLAAAGRLDRSELAHHVDGRRAHNDVANLEPKARGEHSSEHARQQKREKDGRFAR